MIVADATALILLARIGRLELLREVLGEVWIYVEGVGGRGARLSSGFDWAQGAFAGSTTEFPPRL